MRYPTPSEVAAASTLATLGALPLGQVPESEAQGSELAYTVGGIAGASLGGGIIGWAAGGDRRGAAVGALLAGGLGSMATAFQRIKGLRAPDAGPTTPANRGQWVAVGLLGLLGVGASIYLAGGRQ